MPQPIERHLPIAGTFNIRDLGGYGHPGGMTCWRRVLRGDGLHRLDGGGIAELKRAGVTTVIDLRHVEELEHQPDPFRFEPGVAYHNISLFEALAPAAMHTRDVLHDLYIRALTLRGDRIAQVLKTVADAPDGVVLFHCTAGKDRTGLIAALLLALVGVDGPTIVEDYALTRTLLAPAIEGFITDASERGIDIESFRPLLACEPDTMAAALDHLVEHHGSVEAYLTSVGLDQDAMDRLKARLSENG